MKNFDIAIKSDKVFIDNRLVECNLGIKDGKISTISKEGIKAKEIIDAQGKIVLPGTIDPHVHIRNPGQEEKETFETGTKAAAAGGVTTVIEMPVSTPAASSPEIIKKRMDLAKDQIVVDLAFYGAAGRENIDNIIPCSKTGIVAFKTFLTEVPPGRERDYEGLTAVLDSDLYEVMKEIAKVNGLAAFHAENNSIIKYQINKFRNEGKVSPIYHAKSRPPINEVEATSRILLFAEELGTRVQICHISTPKVVDLINIAKRKGVYAIAETCLHYLVLNENTLKKYGPFAKCNPPLRSEKEQQDMWEMINNGSIDTVASDHAPHTIEEIEKGMDNIFNATSGMPGIELRLPILFTKVKERKLSLTRMVELISSNPAKIFGLYPKKGVISVGSDADFVIIDPNMRRVISTDKLFTKCKDGAKVYDGWEVYGMPEYTIVRGNLVFANDKIMSLPGYGEIVKLQNNLRIHID